MSFTFKYQSKDIFFYNSSNEDLTCPYCNTIYDINCSQLKFAINQHIKERQFHLPFIRMRCIMCDLYSDTYPFKQEDKTSKFKLNDGQKKTIEELYNGALLSTNNDQDHTCFLVEGYAGTGKTSIIAYFLRYPEFSEYGVCFSAPTNKALNVLMEKLVTINTKDNVDMNKLDMGDVVGDVDNVNGGEEKDWKFKTVFKLMNNKMMINAQGETTFDFKQADLKKSLKHDIVIIDEASMVEEPQFRNFLDLMETLKRERQLGGIIPLVFFLGDDGQLPPINEESSIIFNPTVQKQYNVKRLCLTEIMRSQDRITDLSLAVRELIPKKDTDMFKKDFASLDLKKFVCGQINYYGDQKQWINHYAETFKNNLKTSEGSTGAPIILVYTNQHCDKLNSDCRNLIFNNPSEKYVKGELLVFNGYYSLVRQKIITSQPLKLEPYTIKFYTSETIIIDAIQSDNITIDSFRFASIFKSQKTISEKLTKKIMSLKLPKQRKDLLFKDVTNIIAKWEINEKDNLIKTSDSILDKSLNKLGHVINAMDHKYDVYKLNINAKSKFDIADHDPDNCVVTVIKDNCNDRYHDTYKEIKKKIRFYYDLLNNAYKNNQLMKFIIDFMFQQIWLHYYYKKYIWPYAEITYGYVLTTHKSQGSTYSKIYVDVANILGCVKVNNIVKAKSLYTAMTRASKCVNVFHNRSNIYQLFPNNKSLKCCNCNTFQDSNLYSNVNCSIDKKCADLMLSKIKPMTIYKNSEDYIILSDKYKNLYDIPIKEIDDIHINDALHYVSSRGLSKTEIDKYQYSNLIKAIKIKT